MSPASAPRGRALLASLILALALAASWIVVFRADLTPQLGSDFFFATDDPQLQASSEIELLFPATDQLLLSASGNNALDPDYLQQLEKLTLALTATPGITGVQSLTQGPAHPDEAASSPLWSRLLLATDDPGVSQLIVSVAAEPGEDLIARVEKVAAEHQREDFEIRISGVPYVAELIGRHLGRDLRLFSTTALAVFGLLIALLYRSPWLVSGTLMCCLGACAMTLAALHLLGTAIGALTANLVPIVFVLTLSHTVFLTAAWKRASTEADGEAAVRRAVAQTRGASFWCMSTTLLGFTSLLLASARPLRELGVAGAIGAALAIGVAYGLYPAFLSRAAPSVTSSSVPGLRLDGWLGGTGKLAPLGLGALTLVAAFGLPRLETDPSLLDYFAAGSEIRQGLEQIDRDGGSSPLSLVVTDPRGGRLDSRDNLLRLEVLQEALEARPEVGTALSVPVLLAEARKVPLAFLFPAEKLLDLLGTQRYDRVAQTFITPDRLQARFFLRMREAERAEPRRQVISKLTEAVHKQGLEPRLVGGLYALQGQLGELVAASLIQGLGGLLILFLLISAGVSRSLLVTVIMVAALAAVPVLVLGSLGLLGKPLDVVSAPGANVAIALGIDSMIHLVFAARRRAMAGGSHPWTEARHEMAPPILGAALILAAGFSLFLLSSFPPSQRFGLAVALGTLASAAMALWVLPAIAGSRRP